MAWFKKAQNATVNDPGRSSGPKDGSVAEAQRSVDTARNLLAQGNRPAALALLDQILEYDADNVEALVARGSVLYQWSRFIESYRAFRDALKRFPDHVNLLAQSAWAAHSCGEIAEAERLMRRLVELRPAESEAHYGLGVALRAQKRYDEALPAFERAAELDESAVHAHVNIGVTLMDLGRFADAEAPLRKAIALAPDNAGNWINLGVNLYRQKKPDAETAYKKGQALELEMGQSVDGFVSYASFLRNVGRLEESIEQYRVHLPTHPNTAGLTQLGMCLLHKGDYSGGWPLYEFRWLQDPLVSLRANLDTPVWQGQDVSGKTVLVRAEQGIGDVIQFARYLREVKRLGATVLFQSRDGMEALSSRFEGVDGIIDTGQKLPHFDYFTNLMSLPRYFGDHPKAASASPSYIRVDVENSQRFRQRLNSRKINVGLVWGGNPTHLQDSTRSISLSLLSPLASIDRINLISLQKGAASKQLEAFEAKSAIDDWAPMLDTFADTADAVATLDLVISVDTSVAHLAGALEKPLWVLLPTPAEWRWMDDRSDSDWYPTATLFRQRTRGDWASVITEVVAELTSIANSGLEVSQRSKAVTPSGIARAPGFLPIDIPEDLAAISEAREGIFMFPADHRFKEGVSLKLYGEWHHEQLALLARLVKLGQTIVEVGSGAGVHTVALSRLVGPSGHVIAYESGQPLRRMLIENLRSNRARNVTVMQEPIALADSAVDGRGETVDGLGLAKLDWLKINHSGTAQSILIGAQGSLWGSRPKLFVNVADDVAAIVDHLSQSGYACWCHESPVFRPSNFNRVSLPIHANDSQTAVLAIPEEVTVDVALDDCVPI
jgi:tetratricopeptide (TPR) repeat protein/precorrin-6B methylase 2